MEGRIVLGKLVFFLADVIQPDRTEINTSELQ